MRNFRGNLEKGLRVERFIKRFLEDKFGYTFKERVGIETKNDMETVEGIKIEVKSDNKSLITGNLFIEIWDKEGEGKEGWIQYCNAEYLAYVSMDKKTGLPAKLRLYNMPALQMYVLLEYFNGDFLDKTANKKLRSLWDTPYLKYLLVSIDEVEDMCVLEYDFRNPENSEVILDLWTRCS